MADHRLLPTFISALPSSSTALPLSTPPSPVYVFPLGQHSHTRTKPFTIHKISPSWGTNLLSRTLRFRVYLKSLSLDMIDVARDRGKDHMIRTTCKNIT